MQDRQHQGEADAAAVEHAVLPPAVCLVTDRRDRVRCRGGGPLHRRGGTAVRASRARADHGAAAVELALVLPLLMLLLFGVIDFGRMLNMQIALSQGAREGVRVLALGGSVSDATARTTAAAHPVTGATVTTVSCPAGSTTADAQVTATRPYDFITPISGILSVMGQPALAAPTLTGRGRMRCTG